MKKIISMLLWVSLFTSCTQDNLTVDEHKVKGQEVTAHFTLSTAPMQQISINKGVTTRSTDVTTVEDDKITDMWVVQFDNSGNFMKKEYFVNVNLAGFNPSLAVNYSGTTSTIYFLANIGATLDTPDNEAGFKTQMKTFTNETQLFITADNGKKNIPLYGKLTAITIPASGYLDNMSVTLASMLARVSITYTITNNDYSKLSLETIRLYNVPTGLTYVPPVAASASATTSFSMQTLAAEAVTASSGVLTFYIPENQRGEGSNTAAEHNERLKDGTGVSNATYIEFIGHTLGKRGGEKVTFRYFLGANSYNDYNIVRNTKYDIALSIDGTSAADKRFTIAERANCYVLKPGGTIEVPVLRANESDLGIQLPDVQTGWSAYVYWTTPSANLVTVSNTTATKGYFTVTAPSGSNEGNALVAIKDASNKVLWSWHIWVEAEDILGTALPLIGGGFTFLDRNLGATTSGQVGSDFSGTGGFYYQWGRKDPFIGTNNTAGTSCYTMYNAAGTAFTPPTYPFTTSAITGDSYTKFADLNAITNGQANALSYSVQYPMLYMGSWYGSSAKYPYNSVAGHDSWGGEYGQAKSVYDPCPAGWRVPSGEKSGTTYASPWASLASPGGPTASSGSAYAYYSSAVTQNGTTYSYIIQAMGYRQGANGTFAAVGTGVMCWVATQAGSSSGHDLWGVTGFADSSGKSYGEPIRCVKNWN